MKLAPSTRRRGGGGEADADVNSPVKHAVLAILALCRVSRLAADDKRGGQSGGGEHEWAGNASKAQPTDTRRPAHAERRAGAPVAFHAAAHARPVCYSHRPSLLPHAYVSRTLPDSCSTNAPPYRDLGVTPTPCDPPTTKNALRPPKSLCTAVACLHLTCCPCTYLRPVPRCVMRRCAVRHRDVYAPAVHMRNTSTGPPGLRTWWGLISTPRPAP